MICNEIIKTVNRNGKYEVSTVQHEGRLQKI